MTTEKLRDIFGKIDDEFIEEAENYVPEHKSGKPIYIIAPASAAVIALCTCIYYHNEANRIKQPEINNSYVVTTDYTEKVQETEISDTVPCTDDTADTANVNTEVSKIGYDEGTQYIVTIPEKSEPQSESEGSYSERSVITSESFENNSDSLESNTEFNCSTEAAENLETESQAEKTVIASPDNYIFTEEETISSSPVTSEITVPQSSDISSTISNRFDVRDFPFILKDNEGHKYYRQQIVDKNQTENFIQNRILYDPDDNEYEVSEYYFKDNVDENILVIYFEKKNSYVVYLNVNNG